MRNAGRRIIREAKESGYFSSHKIENSTSISNHGAVFWREHRPYIKNPANDLGFGNYLWKPFIIHKQLNRIPEGDTLLYLDAGCHLNFKTESAIKRFNEYLEMASSHGSVVTQLMSGSFGISDLRERSWTSPQLIEELRVSKEQQESNQIQAGVLFLQNNETNRALTEEWLRYSISDGYRFLERDDWIDADGNACTSRFDQSIFSCLAKKYCLNTIPDETYFYPNWNSAGSNYPIWAMRRRNGVDVEEFKLRDLPELSFLFGSKILKKLGMRFN